MSVDATGIIAWLRQWFDDIYLQQANVIDIDDVYPIGSIYMSTNNVNPSTLFGGTWTKIEDKFLLASGTDYSATYDNNGFANKTGGEATHTLTIDEMPTHSHQVPDIFSGGSGSEERIVKSTNRKGGYQPSTTQRGSSQAHNNMPPYLVVNVWYRTQ